MLQYLHQYCFFDTQYLGCQSGQMADPSWARSACVIDSLCHLVVDVEKREVDNMRTFKLQLEWPTSPEALRRLIGTPRDVSGPHMRAAGMMLSLSGLLIWQTIHITRSNGTLLRAVEPS
jgi:hypothetical protein